MKKKIAIIILITFFRLVVQAQNPIFLPLHRQMQRNADYQNNQLEPNHSSSKPLRITHTDSALQNQEDERYTWFGRKLLAEDLIRFTDDKNYNIAINPLFDFTLGKDISQPKNIYTNTRGAIITGNVGSKFAFSTSVHENQGIFASYMDSFVHENNVVPGQGRAQTFTNGKTYDYYWSAGTISYAPNKYFHFVAGQDKNFIGDGYRSLLLSDAASNYPFLKIITDVGPFQYTNIYKKLIDMRSSNLAVDSVYNTKYASAHYLDWAVGKRLNIGLFETVVWRNKDRNNAYRGIDIHYLNPIIFFRPVEYQFGSPDNVLVGANFKFKLNQNNQLYAQLIIDELKVSELINRTGWWANKQGYQIGFKSFNVFGINNLDFLTEYNRVRPFTYSQRSSRESYSHQNQPLAHPLGANFWESATLLSYQNKALGLHAKFVYAMYGADSTGTNYGKNVELSYQQRTPPDYGNFLGQGIKTNQFFIDVRASYLLNPRTNMRIELGLVQRKSSSRLENSQNSLITVGFKTDLWNYYYDFR